MEIAIRIVGGVVSTALGGVVVHMLVASRLWPVWLDDLSWRANDINTSRLEKLRLWGYLVAGFLGFGAIGYVAATTGLWWVPSSWGFVDEDGVFTTLAHSFAGLTGMVAAFGMPALLLRLAKLEARDQRSRQRATDPINE